MTALRIAVDRDRCVGAGQCVLSAPDLFDQSDEDGTVVVVEEHPPPGAEAGAREAVRLCPARVISLADD